MELTERPTEEIVYADFLTDEEFFPEILYDPLFQEPINLVPQPSTSAFEKTVVCPPKTEIPELAEFLAMTEEPLNKIVIDFDDFDALLEGVIRMEDQIRVEAIISELNIDETVFETPMEQPSELKKDELFEIDADRLFDPLTQPLLKPQPESLSEKPFEPFTHSFYELLTHPLWKPQPEPLLEQSLPIEWSEQPINPLTEPLEEAPIEPPKVSVVPSETTVMTFEELERSSGYNFFDFSLSERYTMEDLFNNLPIENKKEDTEGSMEEGESVDKVPSVKENIPDADEVTNLTKSTEMEDQTLMEKTKEKTKPKIRQVKRYKLRLRIAKKDGPKANVRKAKRKRTKRETTTMYVSPRGPRHSERVMEKMEMV